MYVVHQEYYSNEHEFFISIQSNTTQDGIMIDFNLIKRKIRESVDSFIGSEFYVTYKNSPLFNVFNKYDSESNDIISNKERLIIYGTDNAFDNRSLGLLNHYDKIFSVNNKILNNSRVISLPLGIVDTAETIQYITCFKKRDFSMYDLLIECRESFDKEPEKLLFLNYRIPKNLKVRQDSMNILNNLPDYLYTNQTFNGEDWLLFNSIDVYRTYFNNCLNHIFIACPEGFGIDSYRFYETLYLGRIPVVLHNPVTDMFSDLPILFLNEWSEFSVKYQDFIDNFDIKRYNFEKISRHYWKTIIESN